MINDYKAAKRMGEQAIKKALKNGVSPYLPVLDSFEEVKHLSRQTHLGLMELPLDRIKGNKTVSRNNAFANNFMPVLEEYTEFAVKWSDLYDSYQREGIRDAITVFEYMHNFYVQEGNKRVSVSAYGGSDYILADVTRIIPEKTESKESLAYYEFMDFYNVTGCFYIVFNEPGEYAKLAQLLGQDLKTPWPQELRSRLNAAYTTFEKQSRKVIRDTDDFGISEGFLVYVSIFPMKTLITDSDDQIVRNIKQIQEELLSGSNVNRILFLDKAPEESGIKQPAGILGLFRGEKRYSASNPLRVGFIYDAPVESSRWIDSHEAGRLYLDEMTGDEVVTLGYQTGREESDLTATIEKAVSDKCGVIFTVTGDMMDSVLKEAVKYPSVRFLNCSIARNSSTVRCYHGKLYEATFLMGVLAADVKLRESGGGGRIGYLVRNFGNQSVANMNAFAIGVSMLDPECVVSMKYCGTSGSYDYKKEWKEEGVRIYADFEYSKDTSVKNRPGVFRLGDTKDEFIGLPYYSWGKYYTQIIQTVLSGAWDTKQIIDNHVAANYWFGLSTGVVDIRVPNMSYQTNKLLSFFKSAIISGQMDPFSGELRSQAKVVQGSSQASKNSVSLMVDTLPAGRIATMDWMNENIE